MALTPSRLVAAVFLCFPIFLGARSTGQAPLDTPPAPKPLVPAAASSIAASPELFQGEVVTVFATVDRILSPTSFVLDQDLRASGSGGVTVTAAILNDLPALNSYVTVIGEVVLVDGRPEIRATSVLDSKMVDLAKKPLPPMTAEEAAFDAVMKRVGPAFAALRQAVADADGDALRSQAAVLKQSFVEAEAFFDKREKPDAQKWAAEARAHVEPLERAAAGRWDDAKAAAAALQKTCASCHAAYRERQDDGTYRIRAEK